MSVSNKRIVSRLDTAHTMPRIRAAELIERTITSLQESAARRSNNNAGITQASNAVPIQSGSSNNGSQGTSVANGGAQSTSSLNDVAHSTQPADTQYVDILLETEIE